MNEKTKQNQVPNLIASNMIRIPTYQDQNDPCQWIKNFERNLDAIGSSSERKLTLVSGYLNEAILNEWFFLHDFEDWNNFKETFIEKYQNTRVNMNAIMTQILSIKRQNGESGKDYIDRFDCLVTKYD